MAAVQVQPRIITTAGGETQAVHLEEWIIGSASDLTSIPATAPGSRAYKADGTLEYMYDGSAWVERTTGGGGGGGGASVTIVNATATEQAVTLDIKAGALFAAFKEGPVVMHIAPAEDVEMNYLCLYAMLTDAYAFAFYAQGEVTEFEASTADDYPSLGIIGGGNEDVPIGT